MARRSALHWQSQAVLLVFVPVAGTWLTLTVCQAWADSRATVLQAICISVAFAGLVFAMRAATLGAALTGGLFTAALSMETPGWRSALWPLMALFLLTWAATRFGRRRKQALGTAEGKRGRTASQVAANLGVAALAGMPPVLERIGVLPAPGRMLTAMLAAMAEATADTVSSELGQVLGGEPRLITTLRRVPPGTDGGISWVGTLAGCLAAAIVVAVGALLLTMTRAEALIALGAAVAGLFIDSLLGAVVERRGWLNNDAVNAISTLAAAVVAGAMAAR
ncbi:MAG: DUF92 domain-containing protein [Acidobacteriaceae bacterium]